MKWVIWVTCAIASLPLVQADLVIEITSNTLDINVGNVKILHHTREEPAIAIGNGVSCYKNDLGNFKISETLTRKFFLKNFNLINDDDEATTQGQNQPQSGKYENVVVEFFDDSHEEWITLTFSVVPTQQVRIRVLETSPTLYNRLYIRLHVTDEERIYGGGEQYTYFNMRNHDFPMWGREQGVGRASTVVSFLAELIAGAGGDYHTTYWPQATYVSSLLYYVHIDYSYYNVLRFEKNYTEIELWENPFEFQMYIKPVDNFSGLIKDLTNILGRQPPIPKWVYQGSILGLQGGWDTVMDRYNEVVKSGAKISGIWIQDWSGKLITSLGKRVYWNWYLSEDFYSSEFTQRANEMKEKGVRFLSYINPHVINGSDMFEFGDRHGFFIKNKKGETHLVDFGDFYCSTVDLTNPMAYKWYKNVLLDMAEIGFSGWMADFGGEYLPVDDDNLVYYDQGMKSSKMHNRYNVLWAEMNREVADMNTELFIFMRSGYGESGGSAPSAWAGDQNVDFTKGDGLASVIPATLSLAMSGMGVTHSDIGGYVSLLCMVRTEELILRWAEMSVFSPVMRTHEGNRPNKNWQIYTTNETKREFARLTNMYAMLSPYNLQLSRENVQHGMPYQRPLFLHYPDDSASYDIQYQYLYGRDLLVAPVTEEGGRSQDVYFPPDSWVYLWDERLTINTESGTTQSITSVVGEPPVFYRRDSEWKKLFKELGAKYKIHEAREPQGLSLSLLRSSPLIFFYLLLRKIFYYVLLRY